LPNPFIFGSTETSKRNRYLVTSTCTVVVKIQDLIKYVDPDKISVKLKLLELDNLMELKANFDPIPGKLLALGL
jgi:hypothetical protein